MQAERALEQETRPRQTVASGRPVYYLGDMFCESNFEDGAAIAAYAHIAVHFELSPILAVGGGTLPFAPSGLADKPSGGEGPTVEPRAGVR